MTAPSVFISYSHKDEEWKDRLVTHLGVLEKEGLLDLWDDRKIELGDDWRPDIEDAIGRAAIAILMVSANFLTSKFILDEEIPKFLARREKEGLRVIPIIVKPCAWTEVKWLSKIQARPKDGKPLSTQRAPQADADLAAFALEIAKIVKRAETAKTSEVSETSEVWHLPPDKISLAKLPSTSPDLFGREKELDLLDAAWQSPTLAPGASAGVTNPQLPKVNILSLVAWGGVGKTALVNKWLSQMGADIYRGAERVFGWSFYNQGAAEGRQVSADQFIAAALTWFGDPDPTQGSPWDKGERLAELIKAQRTLLILDGLEPLQNPPPVETGKIKDPGLTSLLRELARQNPGLVVITTRFSVDDLKDFLDNTVKEIHLENISIKDRNTLKTIVTITMDRGYKDFSPREQKGFISALSKILAISPFEIRVVEVREGSVVVTLEIPEESAKTLLSLFFANNESLVKLKIKNVEIMSDEKTLPSTQSISNQIIQTILFLCADPSNTSRLRLGEEVREIREKLQLAKLRERFKLEERFSVRPADVSQALLDLHPQFIHFSGHGAATGALYLENKTGEAHPIDPQTLAMLFEQFADTVSCVILNACYSATQAHAISQHIPYVIGMSEAIGDKASIAFSIGFYQALGAGRSIDDAYKLGCVQIRLENIPEHLTPMLIRKSDVPSEINPQPSLISKDFTRPQIPIEIETQEIIRFFKYVENVLDERFRSLENAGITVQKNTDPGIKYSYQVRYKNNLIYHFSMQRSDMGDLRVSFLDGWVEPIRENTATAFGTIHATLDNLTPRIQIKNLSLLEVVVRSADLTYEELVEEIWAKACKVIEQRGKR